MMIKSTRRGNFIIDLRKILIIILIFFIIKMFILAYKNTGETIAEFSQRIKNEKGVKYAAICGKLDPMARGLTRVLLDENRKLMDNYLDSIKKYSFKLVIGIKTKSDDILGEIVKVSQTDYYDDIMLYLMGEIANQTSQHFHPYSAKRITIGDVRRPLHYFSRRNITSHSDLPQKSVNVKNMNIGSLSDMLFSRYRDMVSNNIGKIGEKNKELFDVDNILNQWKSIDYSQNIKCIDITMEVSSGYYIRMIPYYLYRDLDIPTHIFDIHRLST